MKLEYVLWSSKLDHIKTSLPPLFLPDSSLQLDSELTISIALVFHCDRGPQLRLVWRRANAPLRMDAGIQSTHWPRIVCGAK